MRQLIYTINEEHTLEEALAKVQREPAYHSARKKLLQIYDATWDWGTIQQEIELIRQTLPDVEIVGMTQSDGDGMINGFDFAYEGSRLNFLLFEQSSFEVYTFYCDRHTATENADLLLERLDRLQDIKGVQLFLSSVLLDFEDFFDRLQTRKYDYTYFGCVAGLANTHSNEDQMISYIFTDRICQKGIIAVAYYGSELHIRTHYSFGWKPVGQTFTVTEKESDYYVKTINDRPATEIYEKYLGIEAEQIRLDNVSEFPLVVRRGNQITARMGLHAGPGGSLMFGTPVQVGEKLQFSYGNMNDILDETLEDCKGLKEFAPQAAMIIPCMNRRIFFRKEKLNEIDMYRCKCSSILDTYGHAEIFMNQEGGGLLNSALVSIGFREGEKKAGAYPVSSWTCKRPREEYIPLEKRLMTFISAVTNDLEEVALEAKVASQAKSNFLSRMSHEIRTPINAVLGMDEMILRETEEENVKNYAMDIYTSGNTLLSLINDILDVSKIESGKMEIICAAYDLSSVIHDLASMIVLRARAKGLELFVEVDEKLPSRMYGDDVRIRQIVTNILTNAVKYTETGSVTLRLSQEERRDDSVFVRVEVKDTGIGIKEEDLPKLTQEFERIEEERNRNIEGTGLGMNITTSLLEMMGSKMQVHSVYGEGSTFYFILEQKIVDATPIGDFEKRLRQISQEYQYTKAFVAPEAKVLVVDDNTLNLRVFTSLLKQTRVQVTQAQSGAECLSLAAKNPYHIIFMDHMMPEMDGIETFHRLRAMEGSPNEKTPVFALTANAVSGAKEMYLSEGFDGFLSKPIVSEKLEEVIRTTLPPELLEDAPKEEQKEPKVQKHDIRESSAESAELPMIDGLDWNFAMLHLPDRELLEETIREFYELIPHHAGKLDEIYQSLVERDALKEERTTKEDLEAYRIQVHSMKSVAATIGILPLAGMAYTLEYAARDGVASTIEAMHGIFIKSWRSYEQKLQGVFGIGEGEKQKLEDTSLIRAKLEMLKLSMIDLDVDTADPIIEELLSYDYSPQTGQLMQELKIAVTALEDDRAIELAEELIGLEELAS